MPLEVKQLIIQSNISSSQNARALAAEHTSSPSGAQQPAPMSAHFNRQSIDLQRVLDGLRDGIRER